jgi:hypothetical protein
VRHAWPRTSRHRPSPSPAPRATGSWCSPSWSGSSCGSEACERRAVGSNGTEMGRFDGRQRSTAPPSRVSRSERRSAEMPACTRKQPRRWTRRGAGSSSEARAAGSQGPRLDVHTWRTLPRVGAGVRRGASRAHQGGPLHELIQEACGLAFPLRGVEDAVADVGPGTVDDDLRAERDLLQLNGDAAKLDGAGAAAGAAVADLVSCARSRRDCGFGRLTGRRRGP